jgi:hypothetical protein
MNAGDTDGYTVVPRWLLVASQTHVIIEHKYVDKQ